MDTITTNLTNWRDRSMGRKQKKHEKIETASVTFHRDQERIEAFVDWLSDELIHYIEEQWTKGYSKE